MRGAMWDAAIVGAGPAGSTAAALLAARGFKVLLLDRAAFPRPKPCAEYLGPGALSILQRIGFDPPASASRSPICGMRIVAADGTAFEGRFLAPERGIGIRRELLDTALVELAARRGACVLERTTVTDLLLEERRVVVNARTDHHRALSFEARLLIGADGLHSRIAQRLGLAGKPRFKRVAIVSHAEGIELQDGLAEIHLGPDGYLGLAPVGGGLVNVAVVTGAGRPPGMPLEKWFGTVLRGYQGLERQLPEVTFVHRPQAVGPFGISCLSPVAHRALLVGDAAEFYDPLTGDGIYAAVRGAELIDRCVSRALEKDALTVRQLSGYRRARNRAFAGKRIVERVVVGTAKRPRFSVLARFFKRHPGAADFLVRLTGHAELGGFNKVLSRTLPAAAPVPGEEGSARGAVCRVGS
ncbi:MAG: hypothetical protein KatS3mg081_2033 [Gemmatimonadales bacterium]|nr:MAG: hypothetical protein KatS3mg081_2033 [Gemmatimonadales bacterium]